MIIDERYPTANDQYFGVGIPAGTYTEENTGRFHGFSPLTQEAYWLGYIAYDNLPMVMRHCRKASDSDNYIVIEDTVVDNYPCGYIAEGDSARIYIENGSYVNAQYLNAPRFVNNLHPEYNGFFVPSNLSDADSPNLYFLHYLTLDGSVVPKSYSSFMSGQLVYFNNTHNNGLLGMLEFMQGDRSITLSVTEDNVTYTFDLEMDSQLAETGSTQVVSNEYPDAILTVFLNYVRLPQTWYINGDTCGARGYNFSAKVKYDNGDEIIDYNVCLGAMSYAYVTPIILWYKSVYDNDIQRFNAHSLTYYDGGGFTGTFSKTEVDGLSETTGYLFNGNLVVWGRNNRREFAQVITGDDLYRMFALMFRVDTTQASTVSTATYVDGTTYATDVDENDQFLARLKTGNITDPTFKDGLRKWQYSSILADVFDEDEVPPYEPPTPPVDGEESGDRITPQIRYFTGTTNFITQYAMKNVHVSTFGHLLWTSWVDSLLEPTDMWKNFVLAGQSFLNTGSVNVSDAIQFIVSLKLFPFSIPNTTLDSLTNSVIIGTGAFPIEVENIYRINSPLIYLDFGTVTVPRPYGDFKDYDNMHISLVLPYCGTSELNAGDVIGRQLRCRYAIDLQSGSCTAMVTTWDSEGELYPVAQLDGQIGCTIPLTATNTGQLASRILTDASNVAAQLTGGLSDKLHSAGDVVASGGKSLGDGSSVSPLTDPDFYNSVAKGTGDIANALSRPAISCPSISGGAGLASFIQPKSPFVQMRYGLYDAPNNYAHTEGSPSTDSGTLSSYSGYVVCHNVDVSSLTCHTDEKASIKAALESGVYV